MERGGVITQKAEFYISAGHYLSSTKDFKNLKKKTVWVHLKIPKIKILINSLLKEKMGVSMLTLYEYTNKYLSEDIIVNTFFYFL